MGRDFGFADVWLAGELTKVALFVMTLPYSDSIFIQAFPRECTEAFLEAVEANLKCAERPWGYMVQIDL